MPLIQNRGTKRIQQLLGDDETLATALLVILLDTYGVEALEWSAETLRMELEEDFHLQIPSQNIDKLMVAISILTSNAFFQELPTFIRFCNILAGDDFDPSVFDPADPAEMAWGISEALILYPPEEEELFSEDIQYYIGAMLSKSGINTPPAILRIAKSDTQIMDPMNEFADDPDMYSGLFQTQQAKADDIDREVREKMVLLFSQVESITLTNGNTKDLLKRMRGD